jgi:hypothetical protein
MDSKRKHDLGEENPEKMNFPEISKVIQIILFMNNKYLNLFYLLPGNEIRNASYP